MQSPCLDENAVLLISRGLLQGEPRAQAEAHIDGCSDCRTLLALAAETNATKHLGRDTPGIFAAGDLVAGRYQVERLVGEGGMGEVYQVTDTTLGERVALKTIGSSTPFDEAGLERLKAELQLARRVTHASVCRVFDFGLHREAPRSDGGAELVLPFITMELLPGETLRERIARQGQLPAEEALLIATQMAAGLDAAHRAGVVHADLKSDNVIIVADGRMVMTGSQPRVVITDFGLARQHDVTLTTGVAGAMAPVGTLGYMAPEVLAGRRARPSADIYALAVVTFEMLTGGLPFRGETLQQLVDACLRGRPETLRTLGVQAPAHWDEVLRRGLDRDPARRPAQATALVSALRSAGRGQVASLFSGTGLKLAVLAVVIGGSVGAGLRWSYAVRRQRAEAEAAAQGARQERSGRRSATPNTATGAATPSPSPPSAESPPTIAAPAKVQQAPQPAEAGAPHTARHKRSAPSGRATRKRAQQQAQSQRPAKPALAPAPTEPGEDDAIDPFSTP